MKKGVCETFKKYCLERQWNVLSDREIGERPHMVMKEVFGADEFNSVVDLADHAVQGYRGVAWHGLSLLQTSALTDICLSVIHGA